jgi:hypothetical protein
MEISPVAKVHYSTFHKFLSDHKHSHWLLKSPSPFEAQSLSPADADVIMDKLERYFSYADEPGFFYVFSYEFTIGEAISIMGDRKIPEVTSIDELYEYRAGGRYDYMYFSHSLAQASNEEYFTLAISDADEEEEY